MDSGNTGGPAGPFPALARRGAARLPVSAFAQMFQDRPPPVPPAWFRMPRAVPRHESGATLRSRRKSGLSRAVEPADHRAAVDRYGSAGRTCAGAAGFEQAVLALTARYGKDLPVINGGLVWRVFADKPDDTGTFKLVREERGATPNIVLPPGNYVVHVALGLVSAVRGQAEIRDRSRILRASGGRPAHRGPRRHQQDSAEPDFVRALQGQPVRGWHRAFADVAERRRRRRRDVAGRAPTTSSPTTATPTPWCAPTSACRPAS